MIYHCLLHESHRNDVEKISLNRTQFGDHSFRACDDKKNCPLGETALPVLVFYKLFT